MSSGIFLSRSDLLFLTMITSRSIHVLLFSCSVVSESLHPMDYSMPGFPVHHQLLELAQISVHWVSDAIKPSHPLSSPSSAFKLSSIRVFSNESVLLIRRPKYWSFSFSISPSNEYLELISFRVDWFELLEVQGTLKSLLQHHSSKAWVLWCSAFFMVQLSHLYMTIGKTIALTRWTSVSKVMSLFFNMLSRLDIAFLPRSKHFLISWLQSPSAVILESKKIKSINVSVVSLPICHKVMANRDWKLWSSFFECWVLSQLFHSLLLLSPRSSLVLLPFLP